MMTIIDTGVAIFCVVAAILFPVDVICSGGTQPWRPSAQLPGALALAWQQPG